MRDEVAVVVGVLAVVAWLLWARFVVALAVEARYQLAELRTSGEVQPTRPRHRDRAAGAPRASGCSPSGSWPRR